MNENKHDGDVVLRWALGKFNVMFILKGSKVTEEFRLRDV